MRKLIEEIVSPVGAIRRAIFEELIQQVPAELLWLLLGMLFLSVVGAVTALAVLANRLVRQLAWGRGNPTPLIIALALGFLGLLALLGFVLVVLREIVGRSPP